MHLSQKTIRWLERELTGVLNETRPLLGGTSSRLWQLKVSGKDSIMNVVLREYTNRDWLAVEPEIAEQEARNLIALEDVPVCAPNLLASDPYAFKTAYPTVVMSLTEGQVSLNPTNKSKWIDEMAKMLAHIHETPVTVASLYFRYFDPSQPVTAEWSSQPEAWKRAFKRLKRTVESSGETTFIHRDFHPGNVLFEEEKITGIVDWPNACMGPREVDVAHCRWNLAMMHGQETADTFLSAYLTHSSLKNYDPYWDLEASANVFSETSPEVYPGWEAFGYTDLTAEMIRERMDAFLTQALNKEAN